MKIDSHIPKLDESPATRLVTTDTRIRPESVANHISWEAEHIRRPATSDSDSHTADKRTIPRPLDYLDITHLARMPTPALLVNPKAAKKYNTPTLALIDPDNFERQVGLYRSLPSSGGVPGYIDAFMKGEPGGRTEGFALRPEQFCTTSFHPNRGGFLISPNPSNIPEKGKTWTSDAKTLRERTLDGNGFGLVAYWIPPHTYEDSAVFRALFAPGSTQIPERSANDSEHPATNGRETRNKSQESNAQYRDRTGKKFLSIPLDLERMHIPLLEELKNVGIKHLEEVYGTHAPRDKIEIYSHSPIYAMSSCGLHFHFRVNEGRHALESDLRNLSIDDALSQLREHGSVTHRPSTTRGDFISYNLGAKGERAAIHGVQSKSVPNPWVVPPKSSADSRLLFHPKRMLRDDALTAMAQRSAAKYDFEHVGLVSPAAVDERIERYRDNKILPNFIHDFLVDQDNEKSTAMTAAPSQFAGTAFSSRLGGIVLMPNPKYIHGKSQRFNDPSRVAELTRHSGGFALVGYWIPPGQYENTKTFRKIFGAGHDDSPVVLPVTRPTVKQYEDFTGSTFLVNPIDLTHEYIPLLDAFTDLTKAHLRDVYGMDMDSKIDKVDLYLHAPLYGNKTAGLHFHVRVNQALPAGEMDANRLSVAELRSILEHSKFAGTDAGADILAHARHTRSGALISFSAAWGPQQFNGLDVRYVDNPWRRPAL